MAKKAKISVLKIALVIFDIVGLALICLSIVNKFSNIVLAVISTLVFIMIAVLVCIKPIKAELEPIMDFIEASNFKAIFGFAGNMKKVFFAVLGLYMVLLYQNPIAAQDNPFLCYQFQIQVAQELALQT